MTACGSVRELEELAFAAWPAAEVLELDGWRLRHTPPGLTRRANSAWAGPAQTSLSLAARIDAVERFYRERGAPARIHLPPFAESDALDRELAARGWSVESPVSVQAGDAAEIAERCRGGVGPPARIDEEPDPSWVEVVVTRTRFAAAPEMLRGLLGRLGNAAVFASALDGSETIATALGVRARGWLGVFSMFTLPGARRRGAARALLGALADFAVANGAPELYLQVERNNANALALYGATGFREVYGTHYRLRAATSSDGTAFAAAAPG